MESSLGTTSFPGSLILPLGAPGGKMRDPGNEVALGVVQKISVSLTMEEIFSKNTLNLSFKCL